VRVERANGPGAVVRLFLKEVRIEHTLFALPFAYTGAVMAAHGLPALRQLAWITLAVLGARTAAMAANRLFDREIDARNPRTARRALATGALSPRVMGIAIGAGLVLLLLSAYELNPLCVLLSPIAALGVLIYPFCKRFTWLTHFVLGAVDGFAPLGAYIAVAGTVTATALILLAAVAIWVAGFDIAYALMDLPVDTEQSIRSLPARFGAQSAKTGLLLSHGVMVVLLALAGSLAAVPWPYYLGVAAAAALLAYEWALFESPLDVFALNDRIFNANMLFSLLFLAAAIAGFAIA
jgi:4-hydroxybenzoate polyprenyltransferase